jgi:hypothetical protein
VIVRRYCSLSARAAREPLAGTASHGRGCIVFAYPKRLWHRNALASEGLPKALTNAFAHAQEQLDVVTRFVSPDRAMGGGAPRGGVRGAEPWSGSEEESSTSERRRGPGAASPRAAPEARTTEAESTEITFYPAGMRFEDVPLEAAADVVMGYVRGTLTSPRIAPRPMLLVCTHGQRDRCCARFGLALTRALEACDARERVEVREASHLGGDRFAPTVLVLPSGHMYGHLTPDDAPALLRAALGGPPLLPRFRGSFWREPLEQLADVAAFGLSREGEPPPTLSTIEVADLDDTHSELSFRAHWPDRSQALRVRCLHEHRRVHGDCRALDTGRTGGVDTWRIVEVRVPD